MHLRGPLHSIIVQHKVVLPHLHKKALASKHLIVPSKQDSYANTYTPRQKAVRYSPPSMVQLLSKVSHYGQIVRSVSIRLPAQALRQSLTLAGKQ